MSYATTYLKLFDINVQPKQLVAGLSIDHGLLEEDQLINNIELSVTDSNRYLILEPEVTLDSGLLLPQAARLNIYINSDATPYTSSVMKGSNSYVFGANKMPITSGVYTLKFGLEFDSNSACLDEYEIDVDKFVVKYRINSNEWTVCTNKVKDPNTNKYIFTITFDESYVDRQVHYVQIKWIDSMDEESSVHKLVLGMRDSIEGVFAIMPPNQELYVSVDDLDSNGELFVELNEDGWAIPDHLWKDGNNANY